MSYKVLNQNVPGTATKVGPDDWDKLTKTFNGVTNIANPIVDSNFTFKHGRCRFLNNTNNKVVSIGTQFNTQDLMYYLPQPIDANDDTLMTNNAAAIVKNKIMDTATNTFTGMLKSPSVMKQGIISCGVVSGGGSGFGLLNGFIDMPRTLTATDRGTSSDYGNFWRYGLGNTTANTALGIRMPGTYMRKELDCRIRTTIRLNNSVSNARLYVGFSSDFELPTDDTPLPTNESGVLMGYRSTDSTIRVFRNGGTNSQASTASVTDTAISKGTAGDVKTFDISFFTNPSSGQKAVNTRIWNGRVSTAPVYNVTHTTNMPGLNQSMAPSVQCSFNNTNQNEFDIFMVEVEQM